MTSWLYRVRDKSKSPAPPPPAALPSPSHSPSAPVVPRPPCNKRATLPPPPQPTLHHQPTQQRLRILCLHGYLGSASVLRNQASPVVAALNGIADFIFVDAPSLARGDYGWWHFGTTYKGWDETHATLQQFFATQGPFDGVLGMSQGAVLTSVLVGLNGTGSINFDFGIMFGGFKARDRKLAALYDAAREKYALPSVHVYGMSDTIVSPEASAQLAETFKDPLVIVHDGGHIIPAQREVTGQIAEFVKNQWANKNKRLTTH